MCLALVLLALLVLLAILVILVDPQDPLALLGRFPTSSTTNKCLPSCGTSNIIWGNILR